MTENTITQNVGESLNAFERRANEWLCGLRSKEETLDALEEWKPEWMRGHYHCRDCGGVIECVGALPWRVKGGVRRLGVCGACSLMLVEYENPAGDSKLIQWIQVP